MGRNNSSLLECLAEFYIDLPRGDIPDTVMDKAKISLLDYIFVYIVGFHKGCLTSSILDYVRDRTNRRDVAVLMTGWKTDLELAALASGLIAHSVELDDGHRFGTSHPAAAVMPVALAFAELKNVHLEDLLRSIVIGYDLMLRLARAINPSHLQRGFHSTSTCGTLGAAAAASVLLQYNSKQMTHALGISGLFSSGLQEMLHSHPSAKALQVGRSAQSGAAAALFVNYGMKGPVTLLEGKHGWFKAMSDHCDVDGIVSGLGERWEIMETYTKLYPTCRHCHPAVDLAIEIYNMGYRIDDIDNLTIRMYSVGIAEVGNESPPQNLDEAMFSVRYAVALALRIGTLRLEDMDAFLADQQIVSFLSRITLRADPGMDERYPRDRGCVVEVMTHMKKTLRLETRLPKGEPDTVLSREAYLDKFRTITGNYVRKGGVETLTNLIHGADGDSLEIKDLLRLFDDITQG